MAYSKFTLGELQKLFDLQFVEKLGAFATVPEFKPSDRLCNNPKLLVEPRIPALQKLLGFCKRENL